MANQSFDVTRTLCYRVDGEFFTKFEDAMRKSEENRIAPSPIYFGTRVKSAKDDVFFIHRVVVQCYIDWPQLSEETSKSLKS